jgi:hypothetical protein
LLAVLSLFWPAILQPLHILHPTFSPFSDTMIIHWPKAQLMAQSWQAGEGLPYWTPLILSGMPLAANQLGMLFYPPAWLFLFLPVELTFNLLFVFHLWFGGLGILLLLREGYKLPLLAALLGGLTFALNGKVLAHAAGGHVSLIGAIGWLPWVLFGMAMLLKVSFRPAPKPAGAERPETDRSSRALIFRQMGWAMLVAVALAMQLVTHTLLLIYSVYLMLAMVVWHFVLIVPGSDDRNLTVRDRRPATATSPITMLAAEAKRLLVPLVSIPILAGLLGAAQLLPLLELVPFSNRSLTLDQAAAYAVTPAQIAVGLLLPTGQAGHEFVIYLGLIPLLLAPFGLSRRSRWSWFYGGLFAFTIIFALGPSTPVHGLVYQFVPGFRWVRTPARIFFVGGTAMSVLVGFASARLVAVEWSVEAGKRFTLAALALGLCALILGVGLAFGLGQMSRAALALAFIIPAGLALIWLSVKRIISAQIAILLLGILLFLDLVSFDWSLMRFISPDEALRPGRTTAEFLTRQPDHFRVYSPSYSLPMQTAAAFQLHLADGVEPVHLASYDQFMARAGGYHDASFSVTIPNFADKPLDTALKETTPDLRLLGLLGVKYLAASFPMAWTGLNLIAEIDGTYIYTNAQVVPPARVVHQTVSASKDWLDQLESVPDLANVAIIEGGPQLLASTSPATPAQVTDFRADRIEIETEISEPGWLVVSEIWYPGWRATANGRSVAIERVNGLLRGVYLGQPDSYRIVMEYRPDSVIWGVRIALLTVGLMILTVIMGWNAGRKRPDKLHIRPSA